MSYAWIQDLSYLSETFFESEKMENYLGECHILLREMQESEEK